MNRYRVHYWMEEAWGGNDSVSGSDEITCENDTAAAGQARLLLTDMNQKEQDRVGPGHRKDVFFRLSRVERIDGIRFEPKEIITQIPL